MALLSADDVIAYVLRRGDENAAGAFAAFMPNLLIEAWRELWTEHPFLGLLAYPPHAQGVPAAITTLTLTATAGGTAGTLSGIPTGIGGGNVSVAGWWALIASSPSGETYYIRVTAHTAGLTAVTLDAVIEDLAAQSVVLAKMELALPSDFGVPANGLWAGGAGATIFVPLRTEEKILEDFPGLPQQSWPPAQCARVGMTTLRLSHYDILPHRVEIPYFRELADPSGSGALGIPTFLIPAFSEKALAILYEMKGDTRRTLADARYGNQITKARGYENLLRVGVGERGRNRRNEPYGD